MRDVTFIQSDGWRLVINSTSSRTEHGDLRLRSVSFILISPDKLNQT